MENLKELLIDLEYGKELSEWVGDKTIEQVVETIYRGDWLLLIAKKLNINIKPLTLPKEMCSEEMFNENHLPYIKTQKRKRLKPKISDETLQISDETLELYQSHSASVFFAAILASYNNVEAGHIYKENQLVTANICREIIGQAIIDKVNEMLTPKPRGLCIYKYYG